MGVPWHPRHPQGRHPCMLSTHVTTWLLTSNKRPETFWRKKNTKIPKHFLKSFAIVFLCPSESSEKNPCKQLENGIQARKGGTSNNPKFLTGYVADLPQSLTCKHCKSFLWNCLVSKLQLISKIIHKETFIYISWGCRSAASYILNIRLRVYFSDMVAMKYRMLQYTKAGSHNTTLNFIYSEKATKFCKISTLLLSVYCRQK